jgi:hypothetical protein
MPKPPEEKKPVPAPVPPVRNVKKDDDDKKGIFGIFKKK